ENIRLENPEITRAQCEAAARAVGADAFVRSLPEGYDTLLGERGATLSVGQKQLLSFARVLAFDPPVLILDEATASIDPETEKRLQDAVHIITEGRTSIVIAHRLATIREAHRVAVLHKGELKELGTLQELLDRKGLFHALYRLQYPEAGQSLRAG
ncbi:MAG: ATP-binding cassette domain-containing protein, partial [Planctomycetota bacterium]